METETKILIAAISAGSAIAGAVISQVVSIIRDILDKRHQRKVLLRTKYEELAMLVTNSQEWVTSQLSSESLSILKANPPIMAKNAMVLAHIYFPKLHEVTQDYVNACAAFQTMLINNHEFHREYDAGTQAAHRNPQELEKYAENLRSCRQELDEKIIEYANIYAKA